MPPLLFADAGDADDGSGLFVLGFLAVAAFILVWLGRRGFYPKTFRALVKSGIALGAAAVGIGAVAAYTDQLDSLGAFAERNADGVGVAVLVWCVAGVVTFYERTPEPEQKKTKAKPKARVASSPASSAREGSPTAAQVRCRACKGRGETVERCGICNGQGEERCEAEAKGNWHTTARKCRGGQIITEFGANEGPCPSCNGRGFNRCYSCGGRGEVRKECEECGGEGTV